MSNWKARWQQEQIDPTNVWNNIREERQLSSTSVMSWLRCGAHVRDNAQALMLPCVDTANCLRGWQSMWPRTEQRTKKVAYGAKNCRSFGLHMITPETRTVILSEGAPDWLTAADLLLQINSDTQKHVAPMSTVGVANTEPAIRELVDTHKQVTHLVTCFDGDDAGLRATATALKVSTANNLKVRAIILPQGNDLNDLWQTDSHRVTEFFGSLASGLGQTKAAVAPFIDDDAASLKRFQQILNTKPKPKQSPTTHHHNNKPNQKTAKQFTLQDVVSGLGMKREGQEWRGPCPVCNSRRTLSANTGRTTNVVVFCHKGCNTTDVWNLVQEKVAP